MRFKKSRGTVGRSPPNFSVTVDIYLTLDNSFPAPTNTLTPRNKVCSDLLDCLKSFADIPLTIRFNLLQHKLTSSNWIKVSENGDKSLKRINGITYA